MMISNVRCKAALSKSGLIDYDYALNPYRGCQHACVYCYAPYILYEDRDWGSFVDIKENIPNVLGEELKRKNKGVVGISTVTDPYQPVEKRYELTRKCLMELHRYDFPICIQTKSDLVLRDLDLIKDFTRKEVGFTITTIDDDARKRYEPYASTVEERLFAIESLSGSGISTWVFLGPIMPYITSKGNDLETLIRALVKAKVKYLMVDRLNIKKGMWPIFLEMVEKEFPELRERYRSLPHDYFQGVKRDLKRLSKKYDLRLEFCY